jgi:hypothetical protein
MESLFLEYISAQKELEKKGGRAAIIDNTDLEPLYEKVLCIEDDILKKFGLPKLMKFRDIISNLTSEKDFVRVTLQLKNAAVQYLTSSPEKDIELLETAKIKDLKTYDILPEIGLEVTLHSMFYFEEYFKKGKIKAKELIDILKSIDENTSVKIGHLHYYATHGQITSEAENIFNELKAKRIPYLVELRNYRPVYPY